MSYSFTRTGTETFSRTHARVLASKIISDMDRCRQIYGEPLASTIDAYEEELVALLAGGYLKTYEFGFKCNDKRVLSWFYTVDLNGLVTTNDRPGKMYSRGATEGALFFNFIDPSEAWWKLSESEREKVNSSHTVNRTPGSAPKDGNGYWQHDRNYYAGGVGVDRRVFVPLAT